MTGGLVSPDVMRSFSGPRIPVRFTFGKLNEHERAQNALSAGALNCHLRHTQLALYGSLFCYTCGWLDDHTLSPVDPKWPGAPDLATIEMPAEREALALPTWIPKALQATNP
jgi:hypothetical protein